MNAVIKSDTGAFFESPHCKIWGKDRSKGLIRPTRNSLQVKACRVINAMKDQGLPIRIIGLKPRQRGSTTFYSCELYCSVRRKSTSACVIAGQYSQTSEVQEMLKTYSKEDSLEWDNTGEINSKEGRWSNGSRLRFETAGDKLAGIASTIQFLLCSEVARWAKLGVSNATEVLNNVLKCVPLNENTTVIIESTAEGASGSYFDRWGTAIDSDDFLNGVVTLTPGSYVRIFSAWFEFDDSALRLSEEQKREIQRTLDSDEEYQGENELIQLYGVTGEDGIVRLGTAVTDYDVWEQLAWRRYAIKEECERDKDKFDRDYPHSWRSAFQKSGDMRFSQTGLALMRKKLATVAPKRGTLEETKDKRVVFRETPPLEARVIVYEMPIKGCRYVLGVDPMTGASQTTGADPDYHGAIVLREGYHDAKGKWNPPCTAARVVPCRWDIQVLAEPVWMLSRFYGSRTGCTIIIEMNQDKGLTELLRQKGANFYRREVFNQMEQKTTKQFGFQTNEKTREMLVEKVATAIRGWDEEGGGIDIWSEDALTQCENFVRKANGRSEAAEGFKDDDVFAIGLALIGIPQGTTYYPSKPLPGWGEPPLQRHDGQETTAGAFT